MRQLTMKKKNLIRLVISLTIAQFSALGITFAWFLSSNVFADKQYIDGRVGLRNYFYTGNGTKDKPYEIVSPIHFYNLSRLQNLGVFADAKDIYFQMGHDFTGEGVKNYDNTDVTGIKCISGVDNEGNLIYGNVLDMSQLLQGSEQIKIKPIGSESAPFLGIFEGNNMILENAKVEGYPDDIGLFGYVAYNGSVSNLICSNLEVTSLGYATSGDDNTLYSNDVDVDFEEAAQAFSSLRYFASRSSLTYYPETGDPIPLKTSGSYNIPNVNSEGNTAIIEEPCSFPSGLEDPYCSVESVDGEGICHGKKEHPISKGYFKATFPPDIDDTYDSDPFTYSIRISDALLREEKETSDPDSADIVRLDLTNLRESDDFNDLADNMSEARIYLVASITIGGYSFSRVIQSYRIVYNSNQTTYDSGGYSVDIYCDYNGETGTNYQHGTNIGLLAGHVDGSMENCYVYNGKIILNDGDGTTYVSESETGLIGEIGKNVASSIDPEQGLTVNGDTGVMNFTNIYNLIRSDFVEGDQTYAGAFNYSAQTYRIISYQDKIRESTIETYGKYLRRDATKKELFITSANAVTSITNPYSTVDSNPKYTLPSNYDKSLNSVDFLWNQVIEDEEDVDRGLGVFKIITSNVELPEDYVYGDYFHVGLGESCIKNDAAKTDVYFSTAECDWSKGGGDWSSAGGSIRPLRMNTLPEYSDPGSFSYPFSRDFNYVFHLNLAEPNKPNRRNYMYNTNSEFLKNYLSSILIDKYGIPVKWNTPTFGMMLRTTAPDAPIESFSSYMPVGKLTTTKNYDGVYYPPSSIVFKIDAEKGANVSVVGCDAYISIYEFDTNSVNAPRELFTMKSANDKTDDMHRYFEYDYSTTGGGKTETRATEAPNSEMKDDGALYGHIFKLPKTPEGKLYAIGSSNKMGSSSAHIYYLSVQGQDDAEYGEKNNVYTGKAIDNVDFLLDDPGENPINVAKFSFHGLFNTTSGTLKAIAYESDGKKGINILFNDPSEFATYILASCKLLTPHIFLNYVLSDSETAEYTSGG